MHGYMDTTILKRVERTFVKECVGHNEVVIFKVPFKIYNERHIPKVT
jgi:hypothetical protein